ncbi:ATP-binding protein [Thiovibrio sp. JS02]
MKHKTLIFLAFFIVGLFPLATAIGLNLPRIVAILEQAVEEQRLGQMQERFLLLSAATEKNRETLRIFSLLPGPNDLAAEGKVPGVLSPELLRARVFSLTENWFRDRPEVLDLVVIDADGQEQFRMARETGKEAFSRRPSIALRSVINEEFFRKGLAVAPGEIFVGEIRILPATSPENTRSALIRFGIPIMGSGGWGGLVTLTLNLSALIPDLDHYDLVSEDGVYHFSRQWAAQAQTLTAGQAFVDFPGLYQVFGSGKPRILRKVTGESSVWLPLIHEGGEGRQLWLVQPIDMGAIEVWLQNFRVSLVIIVSLLGLGVVGIAYFVARYADRIKEQLVRALDGILKREEIPSLNWRWPREIAHLGRELAALAESHAANAEARRMAEQKLRQEKEHVRVTLRSIGDAVIATDIRGLVTSMNAVAEELTGWPEAEAVGRELREVFDIRGVLSGEACENPVVRVLGEGRVMGLLEHTLIVARDGRKYHIADSAAPIRGEDGNLVGVVLVFRDVTEEYLLEQQLAQEIKIKEALAELSGEVIASAYDIAAVAGKILEKAKLFTTSAHGYVGSVEPRSGNLFCHTFTPMLESSCLVQGEDRKVEFPPGEDGRYPALWGYGLNEKKAFYSNAPAEHPATRGCPPGHVPVERFLSVPVMLGGELVGQIALANPQRPYTDQDLGGVERLAGYFAQVVNISRATAERDKLMADLRQAQKMEAVGTLAGGVAHDFNNMLTPILGYTELAMFQLPEGDKLRENLAEVQKAAHRAKGLVQQILTFSRQKGQELVCIQLHPALKECLKMLRSSLPTTIEIRENIRTDCGKVLADLTQVQQVLINLCTNAAHAMEEKGGILEVVLEEVELTQADAVAHGNLRPGKYLRLIVNDSGCGMDRATQERIFEPYFTTKEQGKGTGLGLALVHGIVKGHGGIISLYSEPGRGSSFKIYLPVCCDAEGEKQTGTTNCSIPRGAERVLLVDDEEQVLKMLQEMVEFLGYRVTSFSDSGQAWEAFEKHPENFDLVVTDQTMPGLTGGVLAGKMLRLKPQIPIILCTGFSEAVSEEKAREIGVRAYLMKPVVVSDLARALRRALDGKEG